MNEINKQIPHSKKSLYQHKKRNFNEMINSNTINKEVKNEISSKKFKYNSNGIGCTSSTAEMNSPMNSKLNTNNVILYKHHRSTTRLSKALPLGRNNVKKISRSLTTKKFIGHPVSNNYTANNIKFRKDDKRVNNTEFKLEEEFDEEVNENNEINNKKNLKKKM